MEFLIVLASMLMFSALILLAVLFLASWAMQSLLTNKKTWIDYGLDEED
jgi:hypothetical protein